MRVLAFDEKPEAAEAAVAHIAKMIGTQVEKGRFAADAGQAALDRIGLAHDLAALAEANVIIEAIVERLDVKQALFARLDAMTGPATIIASNTFSLPITAIAPACQVRPERVCGMHFFNPVPLMRLVEIIPGLKTAAGVRRPCRTWLDAWRASRCCAPTARRSSHPRRAGLRARGATPA